MKNKQYTVLKTIYMAVLGILLIFFVKLFVLLLITGMGLGSFTHSRVFRRPGRLVHAISSKRLIDSEDFVKQHDFSDFHILNRRVEIAGFAGSLEYINIDWQKGDVRIRFASDVTAPYAEVKNGGTNILYKKSGSVLDIVDKRGKRRSRFTDIADNSTCDLEVVLPSDYTLDALSVSSVSGDIRLSEIRARSVKLDSVSSGIRIIGYAEDIHINTVNGDAEIKSRGNLKHLTLHSVNSDIRLFVPDGQKVRVHNTAVADKIEFLDKSIEAASGEEAAEVSINAVHADVVVGRL